MRTRIAIVNDEGVRSMAGGKADDSVDRQVQIMTTMHFVLSGARASTVYEAVGRAGMYLTTVSMTLVALGFISSATRMGDAFYVFAFVLLSCLILLGVVPLSGREFEAQPRAQRLGGTGAQPYWAWMPRSRMSLLQRGISL